MVQQYWKKWHSLHLYLFKVSSDPFTPLLSVLSQGRAILCDVHGHPQLAAIANGSVQGRGVHGVPHLCDPSGPSGAGLQGQPHNAPV